MFISFDGVDGGGKSTQVELLANWLRDIGQTVVTCRDPGSTPLGEQLRRIVLEQTATAIHGRSEMLVYMAARAQLVDEIIRPALQAGSVVIADRFLLANVVYQGHAGAVDPDDIWQVGRIATGGLEPDLTFLLDLSVEQAVKRIDRELDRMESRGSDYFSAVRSGFLAEAQKSDKIVVVNAERDAGTVHEEIRKIVEKSEIQNSKSEGRTRFE